MITGQNLVAVCYTGWAYVVGPTSGGRHAAEILGEDTSSRRSFLLRNVYLEGGHTHTHTHTHTERERERERERGRETESYPHSGLCAA